MGSGQSCRPRFHCGWVTLLATAMTMTLIAVSLTTKVTVTLDSLLPLVENVQVSPWTSTVLLQPIMKPVQHQEVEPLLTTTLPSMLLSLLVTDNQILGLRLPHSRQVLLKGMRSFHGSSATRWAVCQSN